MAIINPPTTMPVNKDSWKLRTPSDENVSRWGGGRQVQLLPGAAWECSIGFAPQFYAQNARAWRAFFALLDGIANQFKVYPEPKQQTSYANPTVNGANQTGASINLAGVNNPSGKLLAAGDWMTFTLPTKGYQLVMVTSMTDTSSNTATANFRPILREAPANGSTVEVRNPYAVVSLKDELIGFERDLMLTHAFAFEAKETWGS